MNLMVTDSSCCMLRFSAMRILILSVLHYEIYSSQSPLAVPLVRCASCLRVKCVVGVEPVRWALISATSCCGVKFNSMYIVLARSAGESGHYGNAQEGAFSAVGGMVWVSHRRLW